MPVVCWKKIGNGRLSGQLVESRSSKLSWQMSAKAVAAWMLSEIEQHGCIYQDDVVDYLVRAKAEHLTRENSDGNLVVGKEVLEAFKKISETTVVWVRPDFYWRLRVPEDEPGREARG